MLVHPTETRNVLRSNTQTEHQFTIKGSAQAFQILSNALYSDKPLAVVRELCTNAYDSHVEAGKKDVPFEVILPSSINPTLTIRDFGTGLDHSGIVNIYSKFFESTKTESNDFVGQLGLGSKAPFSMFKTFTVEARKDGIQRVYAVYTNEDNIPSLTLMSEAPTTECNGVAVSMACKSDDFDKFRNAAQRALMYFNPKPIVSGSHTFATFSVKHGAGGTNWKIRETDYWAHMSGPYCVQGFVVYPIDAAIIKEHDLSPAARVIADQNLDFWMPIGSVDVAPSREALSYDKRTVQNIISQFETAASEMRDVIQADINSAKTAYEAGCKLYKYEQTGNWQKRRLFESMHQHKAFTWNGKSITYKHALDTTKILTTVVCRAQSTGKKLQYSSRYEPTHIINTARTINLTEDAVVLIDDVFKSSGNIIKQYLDDPKTTGNTAVILKATKKAEYNEQEIKGILKMLGNVPAVKLSSLPYKAQPSGYKATGRKKEDRLRFTGFRRDSRDRWNTDALRRTFSHLTWERVAVDLTAGGFYVPVERMAIVRNGEVQSYYDDIIKGAKSLGLITEADVANTYGFNEKEINALNGDPMWKDMFAHLEAEFAAKNIVDRVIDANAVAALKSRMESFNRHIGKYWNRYEPKLVDGSFKTFVNRARGLADANSVDNINIINTFARHMHIDSDLSVASKKHADDLVSEWDAILKTHSMLKMVQWSWVDDVEAETIIEYINALAVPDIA